MIFGLCTNAVKDPQGVYTRKVRDVITACGHTCVCLSAETIPLANVPFENDLAKVDFCITLGGDGTMLRAARYIVANSEKEIPLFGINLGNVGFLTNTGKENGLRDLEKFIAGKFTLQKRMLLDVECKVLNGADNDSICDVICDMECNATYGFALNEVVIKGRGLTRFSLFADGVPFAEARADGVIIATPTGSTAYNRSAGGATLLAESEMFAITLICPMDGISRSWVVDANKRIDVIVAGQKISIIKAQKTVTTVTLT